MIISFRHRGLEAFFRTGSTKGIQAAHSKKLRLQLSVLNVATSPLDLNVSGWKLHRLKGDLQDFWSINVNGNWRLTFRFVENDVELVDYRDYH